MLTPNGGVFGRNPKFNNVTVENNLTVNGDFTLGDDIVINDTLLVNGVATFRGGIISIPNSAAPTNNTVLGNLAGNGLGGSAANNVALGNLALSGNVSGTGNTIVGRGAGSGNASFTGCTAVGLSALNVNTANDITAVGANALDANTTGTGNVAVGRNALGANTTGISNTAVGFESLDANDVGNFNVAIGAGSLGANTSGSSCTAIGVGALGDLSGNSSTGLGTNAGRFVTTGSNSTFVGETAGLYFGTGSTPSDYLTNASNTILIGQNSRPGANSQTNQIVIGVGTVGNGSNTTTIGNSSTTQAWMAGHVIPGRHPLFGGSGFGTSGFYLYSSGADNGGIRGNFAAMDCTGSFAVRSNDGITNRLVVESNGNVTVSNGNLIVGTSGKGIDFGITTSGTGTMTSELLSDYEEGTWTPTVNSGVTSPTYTTQLGWYTKIGRTVIAHADVQLSGGTANANRFQFGGLPFASLNSLGVGRAGGYWIFGGGVRANDTDALPALYIPNNNTEVQLFTQLAVSYAGTSFNSITQAMRFIVIYNT